jgi:tRNA(adenine34) deaminase
MNEDEYWMGQALVQAKQAYACGEVPVGCVVVRDGTLLASGHNSVIGSADASAHAEIVALRQAGRQIGNYRLVDASVYVTLEPCMMCVGAMVHARIKRLIFAAREPKAGAVCSRCEALNFDHLNHHIQWRGGVLSQPAGELLSSFFKERRNLKKSQRSTSS